MINAEHYDVYTDMSHLSALRHQAKQAPRQALTEVARQFESLFLKMMMKSMREASFGDPLFGSNAANFYRDMHDDQIALDISRNNGIGLADTLVKQLSRHLPASVTSQAPSTYTGIAQQTGAPARFKDKHKFVESLWPLAQQAANKLGVEPKVLIAQAALETGWGKYIQRDASGRTTYNLFNIKAGADWQGRKVMVDTLEYSDGVASRQKAAFRSYDSYAESFRDYVNLLQNNSRYSTALANADDSAQFIRDIHMAGYATDPQYSDKVIRLMREDDISAPQDSEQLDDKG